MAKARMDWSEFSQHTDPVSAGQDPPAPLEVEMAHSVSGDPMEVTVTDEPRSSASDGRRRPVETAGMVTVARSRRRLPAKHPVTYRLPLDVLDLIELALDESYERGDKLSKEDAVATAIRYTYGHLGGTQGQ